MFEAVVTVQNFIGSNEITVKADDEAGNTSIAVVAARVDTTPPTLSVLSPAAKTPVRSGEVEVVTSAFDQQSKVAVVKAWFEGEPTVLPLDGNDAAGPVTLAGDEGPTMLKVTAVSNSGIQTPELEHPLIQDDTPPAWDEAALGGLSNDTHWVTSPLATLTLKNLRDEGPTNDLPAKGTIQIPDLQPAQPFGEAADVELSLDLSEAFANGAIEVIAIDVAGNEYEESLPIGLDAAPPTIVITSPSTGQWFDKPDVTILAEVTDPGVDVVFAVTATVAGVVTWGEAGIEPKWTIAVQLPAGKGPHQVDVSAMDLLGNASPTVPLSLGVDATKPTITDMIPEQDAWTNSGELPIEIGIDEQESPMASQTATVAGVETELVYDPALQKYTATLELPPGDGPLTVNVSATNAAGLTADPLQRTIHVDDTEPEITAVSYGAKFEGSYYIQTLSEVMTLSVEDAAVVSVVSIDLTTDTATTDIAFAVDSDGDGDIALTPTLPQDFDAGELKVTVRDQAGNQSNATLVVVKDGTGPTITVTSHVNDQWVGSTTVTLVGTVTDAGSGVASLSVDGALVTVDGEAWTRTVSLSAQVENHTIALVAMDHAGNPAAMSFKLKLDLTKPIITDMTPENDAWKNSGNLTIVVGIDEDESPLTSQTATVAGVETALIYDNALQKYTATVVLPVGDGPLTVKVWATNAAGLTSLPFERTIHVDDTDPEITALSYGALYEGIHYIQTPADKMDLTLEDASVVSVVSLVLTVVRPGRRLPPRDRADGPDLRAAAPGRLRAGQLR